MCIRDRGSVLLAGNAVGAATGSGSLLSQPIVVPTWPAGGTSRIGARVLRAMRERIGRVTSRRKNGRIG
jgi:hypothetical protein